MNTLTIHGLDPAVEERLRLRAAQHGHSVEEEVRRILSETLTAEAGRPSIVDIARSLFGPEHGVDLELPPRQPGRDPPSFE